jgi:hypothetical protein
MSESGAQLLPDCEFYDHPNDKRSPAVPMHLARSRHAMVKLSDGRAMVVAGTADPINGESGALNSVEIYDPRTGSWTDGRPSKSRAGIRAPASSRATSYVAGGVNATGSPSTVDPKSGTVTGRIKISETRECDLRTSSNHQKIRRRDLSGW